MGSWLAVVGWHTYRQLRQTIVGIDQIACGVLFFLLAMLLSITKTDFLKRWLARRRSQN